MIKSAALIPRIIFKGGIDGGDIINYNWVKWKRMSRN